jgi:NADP-dependent 3-hydroxy acid dehydrogenase YdfG
LGRRRDDWVRGTSIGSGHLLIDVNIEGFLYGIAAGVPYMRLQKAGHFINGGRPSDRNRFRGLCSDESMGAGSIRRVAPRGESYNIRTTVMSPDAVATELPMTVTDPQAAERIRKVLVEVAIPAKSFARAVAFAMSQPEGVDVNEILFRPTRQER